jgi:hypothetical protein
MLGVDQFLRLMSEPAVIFAFIASFGRVESAAGNDNGQRPTRPPPVSTDLCSNMTLLAVMAGAELAPRRPPSAAAACISYVSLTDHRPRRRSSRLDAVVPVS